MRVQATLFGAALAALGCQAASVPPVGAIYFGDWHPDPVMEKLHGENWTEYTLVVNATPRWPGHIQPNVPLWLEQDNAGEHEATQAGMQRRIDLAKESGVDFFLFDWYWAEKQGPAGKGGVYLPGALEDGFLPALNNRSNANFSFSLMWANQDYVDVHPAKAGWHATGRQSTAPSPEQLLIFDGFMSSSVYDAAFDYVLDKYMSHPQYLRIPTPSQGGKDCAWFSFYLPQYLVIGTGGSIAQAAATLQSFRKKAAASPVGCVHLTGMDLEQYSKEEVQQFGFDSASHYGWMKTVKAQFPSTPYSDIAKQAMGQWSSFETRWGVPFVPTVSVAWDPSPRCSLTDTYVNRGYPWTGAWRSTPQEFQQSLSDAKTYLGRRCSNTTGTAAEPYCPPLLINAWNEWSEGAFLEPSVGEQFARTDAIKAVFGSG